MDQDRAHKRFSRMLGLLGILLVGDLLHSELAYAQSVCDSYPSWPQVAHDPQRSGFTAETLGTNFTVRWQHAFQPDKVFPQVQPIVYCGKVFVGTEGANGKAASLYAFDAQTGNQAWPPYPVGAPILASVAAGLDSQDVPRVYFGAMNGNIYGLDVRTGQGWVTPTGSAYGFSTAPVFAENKVMIGRRDGVFFALDAKNGSILWQYDVGAPILQTAAYSNGKVFFGTLDKYVYALNSNPTNPNNPATILAWKSTKRLDGHGIKDYWPVVVGTKVLVGTYPKGHGRGDDLRLLKFPFLTSGSSATDASWLSQYGPTVEAGNFLTIPNVITDQDQGIAAYDANPNHIRTLYVFDASSGVEAFFLPHWNRPGTHNGTPSPPCIDRDGYVITPVSFIGGDLLDWGRIDLSSRRVADILYEAAVGLRNDDETYAKTCTSNLVFFKHWKESTGAAYNGVYDLNNRKWTNIPKSYASTILMNNTLAGGVGPVSVANGLVFSISGHNLIVRNAN